MTTRSREAPVTFTRPFALSGVDRPLPAGTYRVVVDEEDIPGLSFLAVSERTGAGEVFLVDPDELAAALEADCAASEEGRNCPTC